MRARKAEFVLPPIFLQSWDFRIILCKSFFIIYQHTWIKFAVNPSEPGALSGLMANKAAFIFFLVALASNF
jgi:hypothetical protein